MQTSNNGQNAPEGSPYARHLPALDGLRGFAALGVVFSHIFPGNSHNAFEALLRRAFNFGAAGVDLFFVLSGFLITGILYDSLSETAFFRKFYARRALRIFPLYYGVIAAYGLAALALGISFHHQLLSLAFYLQNTYRITVPIFLYKGPPSLPLAHFWSLAIEEQFYLVWPVAVFLLRTRRRILSCCALAIVVCPLLRIAAYLHGIPYDLVHAETLCRADSLLAGAALALLLRSDWHDTVLRSGVWLFLIGCVAVFAPGALMTHLPSVWLWDVLASLHYTATAAAATGLIVLALGSPAVKRLCSVQPLRSLGKYSYGFYVLHVILFVYLEHPLRVAIHNHITTNKGATVLLVGVTCFAMTYAAAYLSYHLYEKRFLQLKRFFDYRRHAATMP